jgi:hypothetical protein
MVARRTIVDEARDGLTPVAEVAGNIGAAGIGGNRCRIRKVARLLDTTTAREAANNSNEGHWYRNRNKNNEECASKKGKGGRDVVENRATKE